MIKIFIFILVDFSPFVYVCLCVYIRVYVCIYVCVYLYVYFNNVV